VRQGKGGQGVQRSGWKIKKESLSGLDETFGLNKGMDVLVAKNGQLVTRLFEGEGVKYD